MATRLGIELSPAACRLIEIDGRWRPGGAARPPRVRSFAVLPPTGPQLEAMFASLKRREAAVLVWGTQSEHRQVVVTSGRYEAMRREAVASLASVGVTTRGTLADIAPLGDGASPRRPVVVALAPAEPIFDAIRPLVAAGIRVRSVATPAMALAAMAHARRELTEPDVIEAYIAVEETTTCIALMRGGALAIARELPWGYIAGGALRPHEDMAHRLAIELEQYLDAVGAPHATQVCICGGVYELRTTAVRLTERLDLEVEPLDSLFGIDETHLPEPSADFRERVAELRLAWAVAADWPPHLNLLRARRRERSRRALAAAAVVAGVAAGVAGASRIVKTDIWPAGRSATRTTSAPPRTPPPRRTAPASASASPGSNRATTPARPAISPATSPKLPPPPSPPPPLTARATVPRAALAGGMARPPQTTLTPMLMAALIPPLAPAIPPPAPARLSAPAPARSAPVPSAPVRQAAAPRQASTAPLPPPARSVPLASARTRVSPAPKLSSARQPAELPVLPFEASLETILYSPDRRLAIVDGRIVGVGDTVRGARIVDILPAGVLLRDEQGRLRRLGLSNGSRE